MHLQSYRYLSAILTAGSISKAAQTLGISQPSLSQFVQRIEKDLGAEVFDRSTRPLTLTESGRIFFEAEKRVAEIREDCRRAVADIHGGGRGRVVIGASEYREMFFLTEVLPVFSAAHPGIEIALEEGTTRELEDFGTEVLFDSLHELRKRGLRDAEGLGGFGDAAGGEDGGEVAVGVGVHGMNGEDGRGEAVNTRMKLEGLATGSAKPAT